MPVREELRWISLAYAAAMYVRDDEHWVTLSERWVQHARDVGALSELPLALTARVQALAVVGELTAAASLIEELRTATEATWTELMPYGALSLDPPM
jgi:hypothetical protein